MFTGRGKALRSTSFSPNARVYEEEDIPAAALASKKAVKAAKQPDPIGVNHPVWNTSTLSENMIKFPDRPMQRQLSAYDAHKRADYNFRKEHLEWKDGAIYVPRANKFCVNERSLKGYQPQLSAPPPTMRSEFPTHPALESYEKWDHATGPHDGKGGDHWAETRRRSSELQQLTQAALQNSQRRKPAADQPSLIEREQRFLDAQRAAKMEQRRAASAMMGTFIRTPVTLSTLRATGALAETKKLAETKALAPLSAADEYEMRQQVPCRNTTTWSLGGF